MPFGPAHTTNLSRPPTTERQDDEFVVWGIQPNGHFRRFPPLPALDLSDKAERQTEARATSHSFQALWTEQMGNACSVAWVTPVRVHGNSLRCSEFTSLDRKTPNYRGVPVAAASRAALLPQPRDLEGTHDNTPNHALLGCGHLLICTPLPHLARKITIMCISLCGVEHRMSPIPCDESTKRIPSVF